MADPNRPLADVITEFKNDAELAHQFTNGDTETIVHGAGGDYPSLAKIAADSIEVFAQLANEYRLGFTVKTYSFNETLRLKIEHGMNTTNFTETIINVKGDRVYANVKEVEPMSFVVEFTEPEAGLINVVFCIN